MVPEVAVRLPGLPAGAKRTASPVSRVLKYSCYVMLYSIYIYIVYGIVKLQELKLGTASGVWSPGSAAAPPPLCADCAAMTQGGNYNHYNATVGYNVVLIKS